MRKRSKSFRPLIRPTTSFSWKSTPIIVFQFWPSTRPARGRGRTLCPSRPYRGSRSPRPTWSSARSRWTPWRSAGTPLWSPMERFWGISWLTKLQNRTKVSIQTFFDTKLISTRLEVNSVLDREPKNYYSNLSSFSNFAELVQFFYVFVNTICTKSVYFYLRKKIY